jgi:hypothetical protein
MTGWMAGEVAGGLAVLAILDGAFSGFRSSVGRTGLIDHRAADWAAARRGAVLCGFLLLPVVAGVCTDALLHPARLGVYTWAGLAMLAVYTPYALIVLTAIGCYLTLTLLRPVVAVLGVVLGVIASRDAVAAAFSVIAVAAVLAVEPTAGRKWYKNWAVTGIGGEVSDSVPGGGGHALGGP